MFELGIAFGALGSGRTFFVVPRVGGPAEFADLAGIQAVSYSPPGERGWGPAMGPVASPCRIMLYGHGKRGTEGPILTTPAGTPYYDYFAGQIRWLENLASGRLTEPWTAKGVRVWRLGPA